VLTGRCVAALCRSVLTLALATALMACSPRHLIIQGIGNELASQGQAVEEDLGLAREASAFYLKLSEALLRESPANLKLAEAVAGGFTQYAYAFISFEADKLASSDAKTSHELHERARRMYWRAHQHAIAALELSWPGIRQQVSTPGVAQDRGLRPDEVGLAYWAAASWGAYISLSKDDPDAVADLPAVAELARLAWQISPNHGAGALASLMGTLEAARPGGSLKLASDYFDQAIAAGAGNNAGAFVAKAENIALPASDRQAFERLLAQALAASAAQRNLSNEAMRSRAMWLLITADDLF
jgi:TRAP transporter T-component